MATLLFADIYVDGTWRSLQPAVTNQVPANTEIWIAAEFLQAVVGNSYFVQITMPHGTLTSEVITAYEPSVAFQFPIITGAEGIVPWTLALFENNMQDWAYTYQMQVGEGEEPGGGIDMKWILIGAVGLVGVILLTRK